MAMKSSITIEITTNSPFEIKPKTEAMRELAKLDNASLAKLVELSKSKTAIENLNQNFTMIKGFLGI